MPIAIAIPYILAEALAFYLVSKLIGTGWALLALLLCFFFGLLIAAIEMRRIATMAAHGQRAPGTAMGDLGLIAAGSMGVALPGFITTIGGLLLIFGPTRSIVRKIMARKIRQRIEVFGTHAYETAASYGTRANYGSFVVDEQPQQQPQPSDEDIETWSKNVDPQDFEDHPRDERGHK
ncbi:FxsA family protein [Corynebacterium aquilae]|uniref:Exclusion suppressor FxsA n=1 Tax=Corynebacterium aquilae DSM 44791 TaxID=1431546 RepID=A0A1L7CFY3_9CORY|nr:FxsA family protein [Corynebacterium aquilae]APT84736.1 hypothetical protein CAQU_06255 [Corynebacterium aquilae DSM 44791]